MKSLHIKSLATLAAVAAIATACSEKQPDNTIEFRNYSGSASFSLTCDDLDGDSLIVTDSVNLILPQHFAMGVSAEALRDSILSMAIDSTNVKDPQAVINNHVRSSSRWEELDYKATHLDKDVNIYEADGFTLAQGDVVFLSPQLLTYRVNSEEYIPMSAHGMYTSQYINFYQLDGGRIISLSDLFTKAGLEKLPAMIMDRAEETDVDKIISIDALPSGDNFFISPTGEIVFVYQPYEVAPYAAGIIKVPFYPYELSELMTPFGIKLFGIHIEE